MQHSSPRETGAKHTGKRLLALLPLLGVLFLAPSAPAVPATCVVSGTVLDIGSNPVPNTAVRFRVISPTPPYATQDLTTQTAIDGTWSLTLVQGLNAQVDIPAVAIKHDTVIPAGGLCPAAFTSLTLFSRGTLTPATILSTTGPSMGGDLTGSSPSPSVVGLRGVQLTAGTPTNGQAWVYNSGTGKYVLSAVSGVGVASVTAGTGISLTGSGTAPVVNIAAGGVTSTQLATGAAATNVGTVAGVLAGTLPNPTFAAGGISDAAVNAGAGIAWSKINKSGAVPADIGAASSTTAVTSVTAGTGITMGGTATAPIVALSNGGVTSTQMAANAAATNLGAAGGSLTGTYPSPTIAASAISDSMVNAGAAIAWSKINKAGSAEGDITGLTADLADRLSKSAGGTMAGNTIFNGSATFNGSVTLPGTFAPSSTIKILKTATATAPSPQKVSYDLQLQGSVWNSGGGVAESRVAGFHLTPTALNAAKISILGIAGDDVIGSEVAFIDAITGAYNGPVTGNVTGTATSISGNLTGDVTSTGMATTVALVNGSTAANVHAAEGLANAATAANTPSTILRRDGAGQVAATTFTGAFAGNATNITGVAAIANGGTGQATANTGFNALSPMTTLGDLIYENVTPAAAKLAGNTTAVQQFLSQTGNGAISAAPSWAALVTGNIPVLDFSKITTGIVPIAQGGTGQSVANTGFNALSPMTTVGDIVYEDATPKATRLPGITAATKNFLTSTGTGAAAQPPSWGTLAAGDIPAIAGDVTGPYTGVTVAKLQGRNVAATAPTNGYVLQWVSGSNDWEPALVSGGGGTISSVNASGGSTGFSFTGGPITTGSGVLTLSGTLAIANGGTNATAAIGAFNNLSPMTSLGDVIYGGVSGAGTRLGGNTTATPMFLRSTGVAGLATAPTFSQVNAATDLTGLTPLANGGTGASTLTGLLRGNGASAITGSAQASLTTEVTGILPIANGGTGTSTALTLGSVVFMGAAGVIAQDNSNFFWDNTNKRLGIGTVSPGYLLDVSNAGASAELFNTTNSGNTNLVLAANSAAGVTRYFTLRVNADASGGAGALSFIPNASVGAALAVMDNGNVGIETTTPTSLLQIGNNSGTITAGTGIFLDKPIRFGEGSANSDYGTYIKPGGDGSSFGMLTFGTTYGAVNTDTMTIHGQNVGIGTTTPTSPFAVAAGSATTPAVLITGPTTGGYDGVQITGPTTGVNTGYGLKVTTAATSIAGQTGAILAQHGGSTNTCFAYGAPAAICGSSSTASSGTFVAGAVVSSTPTLSVRGISGQTSDLISAHSYSGPTSGVDQNGATYLQALNSVLSARATFGSATEDITLSTIGTTTDSVGFLLPANSVIKAITVYVNQAITVASAFQVGDATTAGRFLANGTGLGFGSSATGLVHVDQTGAGGPRQTSAAHIRITTTGTPGQGIVAVTVFYETFTPASTAL